MLARLRKELGELVALVRTTSLTVRRARYEELRRERRAQSPKALGGYGYKAFSQSDEDGIVEEIFRRIETTNKRFVEIGVSNGLQNNTLALLYAGWSGLWIEASADDCRRIEEGFSTALASGQLKLVNDFARPDNVDTLIASGSPRGPIDLLSLDIDGNDAHVLERITCIDPRVIVLEYNAKFGPSIAYCMQYDASYAWKRTDRFGASLKYFETALRARGYSCVGCNIVGTNAFFVRNDLLGDHFLTPFDAERHFEPARYELANLPSGHAPTYDTFQTRVVR